jgi:hypothetical protein
LSVEQPCLQTDAPAVLASHPSLPQDEASGFLANFKTNAALALDSGTLNGQSQGYVSSGMTIDQAMLTTIEKTFALNV